MAGYLDRMMDDLEGGGQPAVQALGAAGPGAVPALVARLESELGEILAFRERQAAIKRAWDRWYDEGDRLHDELPPNTDIEPHRTEARTASLPQPSAADERYRDRFRTRTGLIAALHRLGDGRAAPVLVAALSDRSSVAAAARALRDLWPDDAVPALLAAAALAPTRSKGLAEILAALRAHEVPGERVRQAFDGETAPQGRASLWWLLHELPDDGHRPDPEQVRDALVFLALDPHDLEVSTVAVEDLRRVGVTDLLRPALIMAAHGEPKGHEVALRLRLNRRRKDRHFAPIVIGMLASEDAAELTLALRIAPNLRVADPMGLLRRLHTLTTHPEVGERARTALCQGTVTREQMMQEDDTLRTEARALFRSVATPADLERFDRQLRTARKLRGLRARFDRRYRP